MLHRVAQHLSRIVSDAHTSDAGRPRGGHGCHGLFALIEQALEFLPLGRVLLEFRKPQLNLDDLFRQGSELAHHVRLRRGVDRTLALDTLFRDRRVERGDLLVTDSTSRLSSRSDAFTSLI